MNFLEGFLMVVDSRALGAGLAVVLLYWCGLLAFRAARWLLDRFKTRGQRPAPTMRPRAEPLSDGHSIARRFNPELDAMSREE